MTCKDCYHYEACFSGGESVWNNIEQTKEDHCRRFKDKSRIVELLVLIGDTVYKICPKCSDKHNGSCENCAWSGCRSACDIGVWVYSDGSYNKHDLQVVPYKVTEKRFTGVLKRLNTMFFLTEKTAKIALQEYDKIRKTKDRERRVELFSEWFDSRTTKFPFAREERKIEK